MTVYLVLAQGFGCNSYILTADNKTAVVVDCADEGVFHECERRNLKPVAVLLTHGHFDHVGGCGKFFEYGVPIYCGEGEDKFIFSKQNRSIFGGVYIPEFKIYKTLKDGEKITLGGIEFEVIATPGHTEGSVCYLSEENLFSGDTLFCESFGRTDLPGGSFENLKNSLNKLFSIEDDYEVCCGHGEDTTLDHERKHNPYCHFE